MIYRDAGNRYYIIRNKPYDLSVTWNIVKVSEFISIIYNNEFGCIQK